MENYVKVAAAALNSKTEASVLNNILKCSSYLNRHDIGTKVVLEYLTPQKMT